MRLIWTMTAAAFAVTGLAACGQSDDAYRASFRTQALRNCQQGADTATRQQLAQAGITPERLCTCVIDKYMQSATMAQLRQDANNPNPPAMQQASIQCVQEVMGQSRGAPAAPALNEAAPAPEAPAAPAEPGAAEENAAE
jgi:hypothetical protein